MKRCLLLPLCVITYLITSCTYSISNLSIKGDLIAKKMVVAEFLTSNDVDSTVIKWYLSQSKDGPWTVQQGINTNELVLLSDYANSYIKCEVIPFKDGIEDKPTSTTTLSKVIYDGNPNADWFKETGMGVMLHFLYPAFKPKYKDSEPTWDEIVNNFDVKAFAKDCHEAGAGYVIFALGQNCGHYCSPNSAYESIVGNENRGLCSKRDLPMELINELDNYEIKMMFYLPGNPPISNKSVSEKMGYSYGYDSPTSQFSQKCWEDVIKEWSLRYGDKLHGWWFDGMYYGGIIETRCNMSLKHNISTHTIAAKAGNHNSLVTYNYGVDKIQSNTPYNDYSAGEEGKITQIPNNRWVEPGVQWFLFTYLGNWWGGNGTQFKTEDLTSWAEKVFTNDGVVCFDIYTDKNGNMDPEQKKQVKAVRDIFTKTNK